VTLPHDQLIEHGNMKMHPEKQTVIQRAFPYLGSLVLTAALFLALPLTQWASDSQSVLNETESVSVSVTPPPPPPPEVELPEEKEKPEEDVQLEKELQKVSLSQINMALNAGNSFQLSDSFEDMVFEVADLDEQPKPLVQSAPVYPAKLKRTGIQGRVIIIFIVDEKGNTSGARVVDSPHPDFSSSAIAAVTSWKFEPGKKDGKSVKTRVRIPLAFSLRR
jgi:periplasmic protein TonB